MGISDYEELKNCTVLNAVSLGWSAPLLTANFGDGYGAGVLAGSSAGLHRWTLSADLLPDADHFIDYEIDDVPQNDSRFTYFFEFIKRHISLGNKPFLIKDPRTKKKFLVSFISAGFDFEQITAQLFSGGVAVAQRRVNDITFNPDGSVDLDYTSPTGSITIGKPPLTLADGSNVYFGTLPVNVAAADETAIERIEIFIDYEKVLTAYSASASHDWNSLLFGNGSHRVRAKIYDTSGNLETIEKYVFILNDQTAPTCTFVPLAAGNYSGGVLIKARAADNDLIKQVEFYVNSDLVATDLTGDPHSFILNTYNYAAGSHTIEAIAVDRVENRSLPAASMNISIARGIAWDQFSVSAAYSARTDMTGDEDTDELFDLIATILNLVKTESSFSGMSVSWSYTPKLELTGAEDTEEFMRVIASMLDRMISEGLSATVFDDMTATYAPALKTQMTSDDGFDEWFDLIACLLKEGGAS